MKSILLIALTLIAFTTVSAQAPVAPQTAQATITVIVTAADHTATPAAELPAPASDATAGSAPDVSANFVGTNDLNLLLLRQAVKKA